jgi:hypothetical protein
VRYDGREDLVHARRRQAARGGQHPKVIPARAPGVEGRALEAGADDLRRLGEPRVALLLYERRARRRVGEPEQDPQRRRLARAVGAEEAHRTAGLHVEGEIIDGDDAAESLGQLSTEIAGATGQSP